jgi:hypothetical protein
MPDFIKICPVGIRLFHADRQTDTDGHEEAIRNFVNVPKNWWIMNNHTDDYSLETLREKQKVQ